MRFLVAVGLERLSLVDAQKVAGISHAQVVRILHAWCADGLMRKVAHGQYELTESGSRALRLAMDAESTIR